MKKKYKYKKAVGIKQICDMYCPHLTPQAIVYRMKTMKMSLKKAVETPLISKIIYEYQGIKGLDSISKAYNIPLATLVYRLRKGYPIEAAINFKNHKTTVEYNGIKGGKAIAENEGVDISLVYRRIKKGIDIHADIDPICSIHEYNGINGMRNICEHMGINFYTVKNRMKKGMSLNEAVEIPLMTRKIDGLKKHLEENKKNSE